MQQLQLKGKTALISGAGRNIGKEIALTFAREGADLILVARKAGAELNQTAKECESQGVHALALLADVANPEEVRRSVQQGLDRFGKIDVLVNVVGLRPHKPFLSIDYDEWQSVFDVNCHSLFHLAQAVIPGMMERTRGSIVALGGLSAIRPSNLGAAVTASKHGEFGLIKSLALEFGQYGIRANMVNPGLTNIERRNLEWYSDVGNPSRPPEVEKIAIKRIAEPHEIANVVLFLASDQSSFVTGDCVLAAGGAYI